MAEYEEPPFKPPEEVSAPEVIIPDYPGKRRSKRSKKFLLIPLLLVVAAALAYGGYKYFAKKPANQPTSSQQTPIDNNSKSNDVPQASSTKTFEASFLGVNLTYPDTWIVAQSDNQDSIKLESPTFSYQTIDKGQVSGNFRIYIRKGARTTDSKYIGRGVAIEPSEKLTYSQPAAGQRKDTYLTLFGLDNPDNFAFFMIAGNFNLKKGETLGPNFGKEAETFIIAGGYSSKDLKDDLATNMVSPDMIKNSNAYKQAVDIVKSLQLH